MPTPLSVAQMSIVLHPACTKVLYEAVHSHHLVKLALRAGNRRRPAKAIVDVDVSEASLLLSDSVSGCPA